MVTCQSVAACGVLKVTKKAFSFLVILGGREYICALYGPCDKCLLQYYIFSPVQEIEI